MAKRILIFTTQMMPTGGMESHILSFCKKMVEGGFEIDLLVPNFSMNPPELKTLKALCKNVCIHSGKLSKIHYLKWLFIECLKLSKNKYQCLYTNGQGNSVNLVANLIKQKSLWIHHHHSSGDLTDQKAWSDKYTKAMKSADIVIACSTKNAKDMAIPLQRDILTVPCFSRRINREKPSLSDKLNLGYYGRLIPEKGIEILAKLSEDSDLNNIEFHVWGEGVYDQEYFDQHQNFTYHGAFYSVEELQKIMNFLHGFLLISSHREGLPICLLESMSAGLPWLSSNQGGISDIVCDAHATRLIEGDLTYEKVKQHILNFADDIKSNKASSEKQIEYYNNNFSDETLVKRWGDMIMKINN